MVMSCVQLATPPPLLPPPPHKIPPTNNIMCERQINTTDDDFGIYMILYYVIIDIQLTDDAAIECQKNEHEMI